MKGLHCSENANVVNSVHEISNFISQFLSVASFMKIRYLYATLKHKDFFAPNSMRLTTKSFVLLPSLVHFYHLRDFANFKVTYEFDAKQIELLAVDIKKELTRDLLI